MPPINLATLSVDLSRIENPEIRRTLRQLIQQLQEIISQQQIQIEALVEMTVDKHVWSQSEYRHYVQRIAQSATGRSDRVQTAMMPPMRDQAAALQANPREADVTEDTGRQVYRL
jgi:hypothetical protein